MLATFAHRLHIRGMPTSRAALLAVALPALAAAALPLGAQQTGGILRAPRTVATKAPETATSTVTATPGVTAVHGVVFDSTANRPLADASVLLTHATRADLEPLTVVADSAGRFAASALAPGRWMLTFLHRAADEYGLAPVPRDVAVAEGTTTALRLALPGPRAMRAALCGPGSVSDSVGVLVGSVRDEETGRWVADASVTVSWRVIEMREGVRISTQRLPVTTGPDGTFRMCGLPSEDPLSVGAAARAATPNETLRSGEVFVVVEPATVTRLEVGMGRVAASAAGVTAAGDALGGAPAARLLGRSRLSGVVSDPQGRPKAGVRVMVLGTAHELSTGESGAFAFDSLPAGSWTVEARAIGLAPIRATVQLAPARPARASLMFAKWAPMLDRVVVYGRAPAEQRFMDDFLARRERGLGKFITRDEIERRGVVQLSQLLYQIPAVKVRPNPRAGRSPLIEGRGGCQPDVFVNGMRVADGHSDVDAIVRPQDILGIEVHDEVNGVPSAFGATRQCLVVGIWTRR